MSCLRVLLGQPQPYPWPLLGHPDEFDSFILQHSLDIQQRLSAAGRNSVGRLKPNNSSDTNPGFLRRSSMDHLRAARPARIWAPPIIDKTT